MKNALTENNEQKRTSGVKSTAKRGRKAATTAVDVRNLKGLRQALAKSKLGRSCFFKYKLLRNSQVERKVKQARPERVGRTLGLLFGIPAAERASLPRIFMSCFAILRELRRLGVDPLESTLKFQGLSLEVSWFLSLVSATNSAVQRTPSMHGSLYGPMESTMHHHNLLIMDDSWMKELVQLARSWLASDVSPGVVTQLVSLLTAFNSKDVLKELARCKQASRLPIWE